MKNKAVARAMKIQKHHSALPERFPDATSVPMQTDVIKVAKAAKHAGVIRALRDQGYKC